MKKVLQAIISTDVAQSMYDLISDVENPKKPKFWEDKEVIDRLRSIKMSLNNHEETVKQNRQLQQELNAKNKSP